MEVYTNESILISRVLDHLGYGEKMLKFRQTKYKDIESVINNKLSGEEHMYIVYAGSKAEGLTAPLESDFDIMCVSTDAVCTEYPEAVPNREEITVFNLEMKYAAPGYTYLRVVDICDDRPTSDLFRECLVYLSPGNMYLSSDFLKHEIKHGITQYSFSAGNQGFQAIDQRNHGPSTTNCFYKTTSVDYVHALICECPSYLRQWVSRERRHQWPSAEVIRDVSTLESHVVPVGNSYSRTQFLEWRICFTKGEIRLVHSLNDCLTKVLILLKQIAKITLKHLSKEMSSYIIKNVVFWLAELNNYDYFTENNLIPVLKLALKLLKRCVSRNNLPSYMIPERNLLADSLTVNQRAKICMRIDCLLKEGPMMICRWQKVRHAFTMLYRSPDEFSELSEKRHFVQVYIMFGDEYITRKYLNPDITLEELERIRLNDALYASLMLQIANCISGEDTFTEEDISFNPEEIEEHINSLRVNGIRKVRLSLEARLLS